MASKLKRIREQQLLSVDFICSVIDIDPNEYKKFEDGNRSIAPKKLGILLKLLGIEEQDINETSQNYALPQGLARTYDELTEKDKKELYKLIIFGKEIEKNIT